METKKTNVKVAYTPSLHSKNNSLSFQRKVRKDSKVEDIIDLMKNELKKEIGEKDLPLEYKLKINIHNNPLKPDHNKILWKYWFKNRITGQKSNPLYIESFRDSMPDRLSIEANSRLASFSQTWELQMEQTTRKKINNKWLNQEDVQKSQRGNENIIIDEVVNNSRITRMINRNGIFKKELLNNPAYQDPGEVRFSWKFLCAS